METDSNTRMLKNNYLNNTNAEPISTPKMNENLPNSTNIVGDIVEKQHGNIEPFTIHSLKSINIKETPKRVAQKKQPVITAITIEVEKCLAEWFTVDTMLLLFSEDKVKKMISDKGKHIKEYFDNYTNSSRILYNANSFDHYQKLCKRLNMLQLEDKRFDSTQTLQRDTKPLPDYSTLKQESQKMELKVKASSAYETNVSQENELQPNEDQKLTLLPLVDKNAQNALRRRIVCQHLNKILPDLLRSLGLLPLSISSDVYTLVNTFKLNANNIMFKPIQWTLIAIVIIKLLSLKDAQLHCCLGQPIAFQHLQLLLLSYKQDGGYLDRLVSWLTDFDRLLNVYDKQLTV